MGDFAGEDFVNRTRSSSEEKDSMTPAQTKRKAQNRAAYVHVLPATQAGPSCEVLIWV